MATIALLAAQTAVLEAWNIQLSLLSLCLYSMLCWIILQIKTGHCLHTMLLWVLLLLDISLVLYCLNTL